MTDYSLIENIESIKSIQNEKFQNRILKIIIIKHLEQRNLSLAVDTASLFKNSNKKEKYLREIAAIQTRNK